jgi:hypothetical protein
MRIVVTLALLVLSSTAFAETATTTVSKDRNTITTTFSSGRTATTEITRGPNGVTAVTTVKGTGYNPMGAGGYHPTGDYRPTGSR